MILKINSSLLLQKLYCLIYIITTVVQMGMTKYKCVVRIWRKLNSVCCVKTVERHTIFTRMQGEVFFLKFGA